MEAKPPADPAHDALVSRLEQFNRANPDRPRFAKTGCVILRMLDIEVRNSEIIVLGVLTNDRMMGVLTTGQLNQFRELRGRYTVDPHWDRKAKELMANEMMWTFKLDTAATPLADGSTGSTCRVSNPKDIERLLAKLNAMNPMHRTGFASRGQQYQKPPDSPNFRYIGPDIPESPDL